MLPVSLRAWNCHTGARDRKQNPRLVVGDFKSRRAAGWTRLELFYGGLAGICTKTYQKTLKIPNFRLEKRKKA